MVCVSGDFEPRGFRRAVLRVVQSVRKPASLSPLPCAAFRDPASQSDTDTYPFGIPRRMPDCNIWVWCGDAVKCPASMHRSCWCAERGSQEARPLSPPWRRTPPAATRPSRLVTTHRTAPRNAPGRLKNQTLYKDLPPGVMASGEKVPWTGGWLPRYSHLPKGDELGFKTRAVDITVKAGPDHPVRPRECGQPAIDGYAHVKPECLEKCVRGEREGCRAACGEEASSFPPFFTICSFISPCRAPPLLTRSPSQTLIPI